MDAEAYSELLKKYLDNKCSEEEKVLVEEWYSSLDPPHKYMEDNLYKGVESRLWSNIVKATKKKQLRNRNNIRISIAASLMIFMFSGLYVQKYKLTPVAFAFNNSIVEITNDTQNVKPIILSDGTTVQLYPKAVFSYPKAFKGNTREVYLSGIAFFDVAKQKGKSFFVYNHHNTIQVVGTSFKVQSFRSKEKSSIEVSTGTVWVVENKLPLIEKVSGKIELTPNKKLVFNSSSEKFEEGIVGSPKPMKPNMEGFEQNVSLKFVNVPLQVVIDRLQAVYGLKIHLEGENLKACTFTGDLNEENLFRKIKLICIAIGAQYKVDKSRIIINGKGC
jgi:transmembrane sensor